MEGRFTAYIKRILLFSLIILIISALLFVFLLKPYFLPVYILLFLLNLIISIITFGIIAKNINQKSAKFTNVFISVTGIKFLVYLGIYASYIFVYKENAIPFTIAFFILYLAYSIFEITEILKFFKNI
jgi:hypothetical protein